MPNDTTGRPSPRATAEKAGRIAWESGYPCDPWVMGISPPHHAAWTFGWRSEEQISRLKETP
jgi:hypothetical protein